MTDSDKPSFDLIDYGKDQDKEPFVVVDFRAIEAQMFAVCCEQYPDLLEVNNGQVRISDIFELLSQSGLPEDLRARLKIIAFGVTYGAGPAVLRRTLEERNESC